MEYKVKILKIEQITHDVKRFTIEKPEGYKFIPGQATKVSLDKGSWKYESRPFTFTCLNSEKYLEFTIKRYEEHKGVTNQIHQLKVGDEIIIREPFGAIHYQGKGVFIAGGAGITPFIAIFRKLKKNKELNGNILIFSNKTSQDIILENELKKMFGKEDLILTLTREKKNGYENRRIDRNLLNDKIKDFKQNFYICGPKNFVIDIKNILNSLGVSAQALVIEK